MGKMFVHGFETTPPWFSWLKYLLFHTFCPDPGSCRGWPSACSPPAVWTATSWLRRAKKGRSPQTEGSWELDKMLDFLLTIIQRKTHTRKPKKNMDPLLRTP